jgi:C-terminal processing protease CtpA/Prc
VTGPPSGKGGLPISVGGGPGRVVVTGVTPGTSVAVAGLSNGDRIVEIDGKRIKGPDDARKAISGLIGSVVMLKVESEGEIFTIVVQRERVRAN